MKREFSDVTRLLCASAILMGKTFRHTLLEHFEQKGIAVAPEAGLDVRQLMQVVTKVEDWEETRDRIRRRYGWGFLLLAVIGAVLLTLTRNTTLVVLLVWIVGAVLQWLQIRAQEAYKTEDLVDHFRYRNYDPEKIHQVFGDTRLNPDIEKGLPHAEQNVIIYSEFSPFVGAGIDFGGWSFATNITYGRENPLGGEPLQPIHFTIPELYQSVRERLLALNLQGFTFRDMLYVNGLDIRDNREILPTLYERPVQMVSDEVLQTYVTNSDPLIRHYQWVRVHFANDGMIVSFFLRFSLRGNNLFTELNRFLLTPPAEIYRELDNRRNEDEDEGILRAIVRFIQRVTGIIIMVPFSLIGGVFLPLEILLRWVGHWLERRAKRRNEKERCGEIDQNPRYNWGVATNIRQLVSSQNYEHYFQKLDSEMYNKVVERTILDAIVDFLSDHNISTADLKERRTTILNSGVIVQGGNVEAQVLAVGESASASQQNTQSEPRGNPA